jgi:hypothetical protein
VALSADVLELANVGTLLLEQHSAKASGKLVNLSGRQRMLSQRMAMFYQAQAWGLKVPQATTELEKSRQEFITAMKTLQSASETTADIKAELLAAEAQWAFFDSALSNRAAGERKALLNVATTSERILEVMDKVTGMYARLNS